MRKRKSYQISFFFITLWTISLSILPMHVCFKTTLSGRYYFVYFSEKETASQGYILVQVHIAQKKTRIQPSSLTTSTSIPHWRLCSNLSNNNQYKRSSDFLKISLLTWNQVRIKTLFCSIWLKASSSV